MATDVKQLKTNLATEAANAAAAAEKIVRESQKALMDITAPFEGGDVTFNVLSLAFQAQQHLSMLVNQLDAATRMMNPPPAPPLPPM